MRPLPRLRTVIAVGFLCLVVGLFGVVKVDTADAQTQYKKPSSRVKYRSPKIRSKRPKLRKKSSSKIERCATDRKLRQLLDTYLGKTPIKYELVKLSGTELGQSLIAKKEANLMLMNPKGKLVPVNDIRVQIEDPRERPVQGHLKGGYAQYLVRKIPEIRILRLGCLKGGGDPRCGVITFLDPGFREYELIINGPDVGLAGIETVSSAIRNLSGKPIEVESGCAMVYNAASFGPLVFDDGFPETAAVVDEMADGAADGDEPKEWQIPIVLDGDATFYDVNRDTVWARQLAIMLGVNLIYGWIEPVTSGKFDVEFTIKGQEAWLPGFGPTTQDKYALRDEINANGYYMITHPDRDEVSYYFVGYDMNGGIGGVAGSICNFPGYDTGIGTDEAHQKTHAWGQQIADASGYQFSTFLGRVVVAAHEIGHMVGAIHGDGANPVCAGGAFPAMCGCSLMLSGNAGGLDPDFRKPFFNDPNDDRIVTCLERLD